MPKVVDIEQRRSELTEATARVIARSGIEAATMREIATEAGWTTGALTHYFADKHALLLATFRASLDARRAKRPQRIDTSPAQRLRAALEGALPLDEDRRRHWLVTLTCCTQAAADPQLAREQRDAYREFRRYITDLVAELDTEVAIPAAVAEELITVVDGVAIQALFDPNSWPPERQLDALDRAMADQALH